MVFLHKSDECSSILEPMRERPDDARKLYFDLRKHTIARARRYTRALRHQRTPEASARRT